MEKTSEDFYTVEGSFWDAIHDDYSFECSMCGKSMQYRQAGMCVSCEQVYNS